MFFNNVGYFHYQSFYSQARFSTIHIIHGVLQYREKAKSISKAECSGPVIAMRLSHPVLSYPGNFICQTCDRSQTAR